MIEALLSQLNFYKDKYLGKTEDTKRSHLWPKVRAQHLKKYPKCELCGGTEKLEVHHLIPFSVAPKLELEPDNLTTLCEAKKNGVNCHLWMGHLGNFRIYNPECLEDVKIWREKVNRMKEAKEEAKLILNNEKSI